MNVAKNICAIRKENGISQSIVADALDVDTSVISNIERGTRELKVSELAKIANSLGVDVLYLITYPHVYVKKTSETKEPVEAILQIKLQSDKKDQVLKLIFGDNNLEIMNR
ncbi:putative transcriptional regulator [Bacteroidales bacterium Barb6XT]|nr:putative transcriptional regulator [Bacteroidales bacterium Barb6XT]